MTNGQTSDQFFCKDCKHHLCVRADGDRIICAITLEFKERDHVASCEYAVHRDNDSKPANRK